MNFIIDQVSWHTKVAGNPESREHIRSRFWAVADYLQRNGLTIRVLVDDSNAINDDFCLKSDDLTDKGLNLMKKVYDKWLTKVDEGLDVSDTTIFDKALLKL